MEPDYWSRSCSRCFLTLKLDRRLHAKRRVPALSIVEDLEVLEDRVRELDARVPSLPIEKLDLETTPEGPEIAKRGLGHEPAAPGASQYRELGVISGPRSALPRPPARVSGYSVDPEDESGGSYRFRRQFA